LLATFFLLNLISMSFYIKKKAAAEEEEEKEEKKGRY
jgi:preprotein translocase subunit SecG